MANIFIEAESFSKHGGWLVDSQSVTQMGSAYLMAHGMGVPVADAETIVDIPASGKWIIWVRTRDWTSIWNRGKPAGIFQVAINDNKLPEILGTKTVEWGWQKAGKVSLEVGKAKLSLHDLTGFDGRCDALYMTTDSESPPPDGGKELEDFRRKKEEANARIPQRNMIFWLPEAEWREYAPQFQPLCLGSRLY